MYSKYELIRLYKKETNIKVKERLLFVIKVKYDNIIPAYACDELHRSRPWGLYWLDRFSQQGIVGLKNKPKSGRHPDISEETVSEIKNELASNKQGWTTKTDRRSNSKKKWRYKIPLHTYLQTHAQVGIQTEGTKRSTCKHCNKRRERTF